MIPFLCLYFTYRYFLSKILFTDCYIGNIYALLGGIILMRLEQLIYFIEVSKFHSFSKAANQLHISQPSISQAITNLEEELGVKLFERSRSGISLTKTGQSLLMKSQSVINMVNEIKDLARAETHSLHGTLRIAVIPSIASSYLSEVLSAYKKAHPFVRLEVTEDGTNSIWKDVISNRIDIGLLSHYPHEPIVKNVVFNQLLTGRYMVCVGKKSSIPLHNPIRKEIIANEPMILFKSQSRQEEYVKKILKKDQLNVLLTLGFTDAAKRMITEGLAIGFYIDFSIKQDPYVLSGDIIPLEIEDDNLLLSFGWVRSKNQHFSKAAQEFIKIFKRVIQEKDIEKL